MHKLLQNEPGKEVLLLGNEAIARGALEAGLSFATCYPGTPSSEIPLQFYKISQESDLYFEYSVNEKVALEVAATAAVCGLRSIVTMKHVGLNVAADPLMTVAYEGIKAGLVIVSADDPSMFSSQNEQDNRYYARLSSAPMLEPTSAQEMKDMAAAAFELSEEVELPVLLRTTTRLNHIRGAVNLGKLPPIKKKAKFQKNPFHWVAVPAVARKLHQLLLERSERAMELSERSPYNEISGDGKWGIVTSGVSYNYVKDAVSDLGLANQTSILKLGFSWPLPKKLCLRFMRQVELILVVEELEPLVENDLKVLAQENGITLSINGKGVGELSRLYEYDPGMVRKAIAEHFAVDYEEPVTVDTSGLPELPTRPPNLCPGCPHRATYFAVKRVYGPDAIYPNDIGCYTLGLLPPISMADYLLCMGASVSTSCGFAQATDQKVVAFIGDSTFFHSGITGLINGVHNKHNFTVVILDNGTTAMTGHQPHPGVDTEPLGTDHARISIEDVVRGCGVKDIHTVKPLQTKKTIEAVKATLDHDGISVVISRDFCPLFARATGQRKRSRPFYVNPSKCKDHRVCLNELACPAMALDDNRVIINKDLCSGCSVCAQVCPENAIARVKE